MRSYQLFSQPRPVPVKVQLLQGVKYHTGVNLRVSLEYWVPDSRPRISRCVIHAIATFNANTPSAYVLMISYIFPEYMSMCVYLNPMPHVSFLRSSHSNF